MKSLLRLILLLSVMVAPSYGMLVFERTQIEESVGLDAEIVQFEFSFTNRGEQSVEIKRIRTSCGCTVAKLDKATYAPGESGIIKGTFTVGNKVGRQSNSIGIITDDLGQPEIGLGIHVTIPRWAEIKPTLLLWGEGDVLTSKSAIVVPNRELGVSVSDVEIDGNGFSVELIPQIDENGMIADYRVVVSPSESYATRFGLIRVKLLLPDGETERTLFLHAAIRSKESKS